MLSFESPEQLRDEPDAVRFWHLAILTALRDKAEQVEVRFGEDGTALLYQRVAGRDWELAAVPEELFAELKPTLRAAARLVAPERPEGQITFGVPGARLEPQEVGWLTYQLGGHVIDLAVRLDPREPWGGVRIEIEYPEEQELAGLAAEALAAYYGGDEEAASSGGSAQRGPPRTPSWFVVGLAALDPPYKDSMPDRDERLAALIEDFAGQLRAGAAPDVEAAARAHPDVAAELRELWAVAQFAQLARAVPLSGTLPHADGLHPPGEPDPPKAPREFGDFELLGELGRGGMGVVYKARQKSLNRIVALKMIREAHLASDADRARFQAEAEAAARLQHPNIVTVHEVGAFDGQAYFCMEYVEGRTLAQRVAADGPLPPREAARLVAVIARAVQQAHDHGILHRDLKPSNILLSDERRAVSGEPEVGSSSLTAHRSPLAAKVTDFGLAKQADRAESLTRTGVGVGTPSYMAPEQATGRKDITAAADVYSLGAILYELLTGRPPFRAANPVDTLLLVLEQEPVPPRDLNPQVPRELELVCLKCLQKPAELRYATAAVLADDLDAFLAGEPMSVEPGSLGSFVSRMLRETHHAAVLENWGLLWMWHSLMILLLCLATQVMSWSGVKSHAAYLVLWGTGLLTWGTIFWRLRRRGGPVLFVERQIAHAWAGSVTASIGLFVIEVVQGLDALTLSPVLALIAAMVFFVKAGTLSGQFYVTVAAYFATAVLMARFPQVGHLLFGTVSAVSFFVPGLKYYRLRKRGRTASAEHDVALAETVPPAGEC